MPSSAIGIDIGTRSVTLAEVRDSRQGPTITNFGGIELPPGAVHEGQVVDVAIVSDALGDLVRSAKVRSRKVWLGVGNQRVVVRQVDIPWMEEKELREALRFQVQEFIPIPVEEAELDYHLVEEVSGEQGERLQRLLLVAGHRDMITAHVDAAVRAGLKPIGVDLNPFAVLRAVGHQAPLEPTSQAVVDVGAGITNIVIHSAGIPSFARILTRGGDDITAALTAGLEVETAEAETRKRSVVVGDPGELAARIVTEQVDRFVDELRSSLDYHQALEGSPPLSDLVLTGGGARLAGLADHLADALGLPVDIGNPFDRWPVKDTVFGPEELALVGPSLTTAVGLALGGLG